MKNNLSFKKNIKNNLNSQKQKEKLKTKIMNKYGISEMGAEKVLEKLENNQKIKKNNVSNVLEKNNSKIHINSNNNEKFNHNPINTSNIIKKDSMNNNNNNSNMTEKLNHNHETNTSNNMLKNIHTLTDLNDNNTLINKLPTNVDLIMEEIIPDYNKQVSIELNHVELSFDIYDDKIDTLKEDFIRTIKRNKSKKKSFKVLKDITFKIYKGEKVGVIGYNGAGKSTLLNIITGIYPPDCGNVITHGNISPLLSLGAGFDYNYTGRENILLNGAILGYEKEFLISKIDEIIEFSELGKFIDVPIKNYSSGMLAKLGFSIATLVNPDILIIDEILAVGDVNFQKKSRDKIKSLMDGGTTVILVSHSIPQIKELCDKAIWIDKGKLREIGEVNEVCDKYIKDSEKATTDQLNNILLK